MLQARVFGYVNTHPEILKTEGWKNLNNAKIKHSEGHDTSVAVRGRTIKY